MGIVPRATSGWFVIQMRAKPAWRNSASAAWAPSQMISSLGPHGGNGLPSRTTGSFKTPSRSKKTAGRTLGRLRRSDAFPFGCAGLERRMRHDEVPDHRLERFRMRRDVSVVHDRDDNSGIGARCGVAAVPADDA